MLSATQHDKHAELDYFRLNNFGIRTARDTVRWHLVEKRPYEYDWSSVLPMIRAAEKTGVQILWDLCHYGWPDDVDVFRPSFVHRFRAFARAFAELLFNETNDTPYFTPVNEISFLAWGGGDHGFLNPFAIGRGLEMKCQLVRASIEAINAIREVAPHARFVHVDPLIHVTAGANATEDEKQAAAEYTQAQFESLEMLSGHTWPQLGGDGSYVDILGVNYYVHNQWVIGDRYLEPWDERYRPFRHVLAEFHQRYQKPFFLAETGIEDERRPEWLRYVTNEVVAALEDGVPVEGICLYPVVNHPGWDDDRHCHNGLWDYSNDSGHRDIYSPLADELRTQTARVAGVLRKIEARTGVEYLRTEEILR